MSSRMLLVCVLALAACESPSPAPPAPVATAVVPAAEPDGFVPMFNGRDLTGWVNVNTAPSTWTMRDGMVVCSGKPTGILRTERMYQDFELELEWRHMQAGGNGGVFVMSDALPALGRPFTRSIEVQVMDGNETPEYTSHGDVFSIHGAYMTPDRPHPKGWERCLPSDRRAKPSPEWNHYRITCRNGTLKLAVNGAEVSGAKDLVPRRGYICLESEGAEVHYRNVRIKALPSTKQLLQEHLVAEGDEGFRSLYDGLALDDWRVAPAHASRWSPRDGVIACEAPASPVWTALELGDGEVIVDVRAVEGRPSAVVHARGPGGFEIALEPKPNKEWSRIRVRLEGTRADVDIDGQKTQAARTQAPSAGPIGLSAEGAGRLEFTNLYVRTRP